jgi:23S rRNA pseudouridine1911/1915/1917 synthase
VLLVRDDLLVVDKPAGVSMATSSRLPADLAVARLVEVCGVAEAGPFLLVHRLDVGTSGVVVLARSAAAHRELSRLFQERRARKTYRALAWGHPVPARGSFDGPLARDPKDGRRMRVHPDGKAAVTLYETRRRPPAVADLSLFPETGRTHQIRVHLSAAGHPIVGDDLYGGATRWRGVRDPRLRDALSSVARPLLHAERLVIEDLELDVTAPLASDHAAALQAALSSGGASVA